MLELRNVSYSVEENNTQKEIIKNINVKIKPSKEHVEYLYDLQQGIISTGHETHRPQRKGPVSWCDRLYHSEHNCAP